MYSGSVARAVSGTAGNPFGADEAPAVETHSNGVDQETLYASWFHLADSGKYAGLAAS